MQKKRNNNSYRRDRVANLIKTAIMEYSNKGKLIDSRLIDNPFTVTNVDVSADLRNVHCYIIPFNTKLTIEEILEALKLSQYAIRSYVTDTVSLRYSPKISFLHDLSFYNALLVDELLYKQTDSN